MLERNNGIKSQGELHLQLRLWNLPAVRTDPLLHSSEVYPLTANIMSMNCVWDTRAWDMVDPALVLLQLSWSKWNPGFLDSKQQKATWPRPSLAAGLGKTRSQWVSENQAAGTRRRWTVWTVCCGGQGHSGSAEENWVVTKGKANGFQVGHRNCVFSKQLWFLGWFPRPLQAVKIPEIDRRSWFVVSPFFGCASFL